MRFILSSQPERRAPTPLETFLRTGRRPLEYKFNGWHDPSDGRFTEVGQGRFFPRGSQQPGNAVEDNPQQTVRRVAGRKPATGAERAGRPAVQPRGPGRLSAKYEARGGPGTVSTGKGDSGGVSYGLYQFSSKAGTAARFVASPQFRPWAAEFRNLQPGTDPFKAKWQDVAKRDPEAFAAAQHDYIRPTNYDPVVAFVKSKRNYDLNAGSMAVREVTFSVAIQHGGARTILIDAIDRMKLLSTDHNYEKALIDSIYNRRTVYVARLREQSRQVRDLKKVETYDNLINIRYPSERAEAQRMLREEQESRRR